MLRRASPLLPRAHVRTRATEPGPDVLIIALGAVVVGAAFLVVSFITENTAWAWGCIGACGLAAVVLVVDTLRRGRAPREVAAAPAASTDEDASGSSLVATEDGAEDGDSEDATTHPVEPGAVTEADGADADGPDHGAVAADGAEADGADHGAAAAETEQDPDGPEPDEEDVDAADVLVVGSLATEVQVVDEHPLFHLSSCPWLTGRTTMALPVAEAVELGFSGCARCTPSTLLAAQSRAR